MTVHSRRFLPPGFDTGMRRVDAVHGANPRKYALLERILRSVGPVPAKRSKHRYPRR